MADSTTANGSFFPIASLYLSHPHILTNILYSCSPTTFDAFRYTCKSIYSMSLDPGILEHHLQTVLDRQLEIIEKHPLTGYWTNKAPELNNKMETLKNARGNLFRLRGLFLEDCLRMHSSWRLGDYKKSVVELDLQDDAVNRKAPFGSGERFDGTLQISFGTVRGDTFALLWGDSKRLQIKTYQFPTTNKVAIRKVEGPELMNVTHEFFGKEYIRSSLTTKGSTNGNRPVKMTFKMDDEQGKFDVAIYEGGYKQHPAMADRLYAASYGNWYRWMGSLPEKKENTLSLLHVNFFGRNATDKDEDVGDVSLSYELHWVEKKSWRSPALSLGNAPNLLLSEHSDDDLKVFLGKDGTCKAKGYAVGADDPKDKLKWKIKEPRRLEADISRMGVWKTVYLEFDKGIGVPVITGTISKNLVKEELGKRFLLMNSKTANPRDWINFRIKLVLPPTQHGETNGKIVLATPAPAAFFRKMNMRDPEIPWADPGFKEYSWGAPLSISRNATETPKVEQGPEYIRTGCKLHEHVVDAEILTRVVGWGEDGAVWVWDVNERNILDCGQLAGAPASGAESPLGEMELPAKKLGYVKDVKGIAVTGDRLVQRVFLITYGKEQRIHLGGTLLDDGLDRDSGIADLRREDLLKKAEKAEERLKAQKGDPKPEDSVDDWKKYTDQFPDQLSKKLANLSPNWRDYMFESTQYYTSGEESASVRSKHEEETDLEEKKWRLVTYSFGNQMGTAGGFYIDSKGDLEHRW
ncbi:hypothetical protein H072_5434 [Dactylellina haptotyla CBS 200.50]|uniref:Uncharacterized protein n=1 Tax=Dactylellina haptotyla (strain CBS 200.50) TaxID=1284197 RepID=S8AHK4_DACHA|nr:hypothetical protein H072_5434 [Dactylellina haptotyla CBS 200.50]